MVTVFDLITGDSETLTGRSAPRRAPTSTVAPPQVLPRLQEHTFSETPQDSRLPLAVAHLDIEVFVRSMDRD